MGTNGESGVDENLYSRQIYVVGTEGMRKMAHTKILITGMSGLGLEIAKNLVLGGVGSIDLHDPEDITSSELSSNYYASPQDVGKNRCEVVRAKLAELNNYVTLNVVGDKELTANILRNYHVVVFARGNMHQWKNLSRICHEMKIKIVCTRTCGLFGQVFCDFGKDFIVTDTTGEQPASVFIQSIEKSTEGIVLTVEDSNHGLHDGDYITFSEVKGMTELNNCEPRMVKVIGPSAFSIGDTSNLTPYAGGGLCTQVKMPEKMDFLEMSEACTNPSFLTSDFAKMETPAQLHLFFEALSVFEMNQNRLPLPWNEEDAETFIEFCKSVNSDWAETQAHVGEINEELAKIFSFICAGNCCAIQSIFGGIVAQEVMKASTGHFRPISQWFYFDAIECLPEPWCKCKSGAVFTKNKLMADNSRYEGQCKIFGRDFQDKLGDLNYFVVGAGAIGCEHLKNFAMMGISCRNGKLFVTDMDIIEKSNLNRQFLFRPWDIGKCKSSIAASVVKVINPQLNIEAHENKVGPETEDVYDDAFFESLDGVANALDNIEARTYIDRRCVYYHKPLLESGTLGTKGNVQVVIPHLTESYSSSQDPPEKSVPMCTLKHFPYQIEHTIQWARDKFEGLFVQQSNALSAYLKNPDDYLTKVTAMGNQAAEVLEPLKKNLTSDCSRTFDECISWARNLWQGLYSNSIRQLLFNFPPDHKTTTGAPFWSGTKRCPKPLEFDVNNPTHLDFIVSAANLRAFMFGIPECRDASLIAKKAAMVKVPEFVPRSGVTIEVTDAEMASRPRNAGREFQVEEMKKTMPKSAEVAVKCSQVIEFEKDDDTNFHMDFITAASNLRAETYSIPPADRLRSKLIAGKIIPAIATTTSIVSGLVALELIKLAQGHKDLELYKNTFLNLSLPFFGSCEPIPPKSWQYYDNSFTIWDRFEVSGGKTLQQFLDHFKNEHKLLITMLSQDVSMLYSFFMPANKRTERLSMTMPRLVENVSKKTIPPHVKSLVFELCATDMEGEDLEVPYVRYILDSTRN
nr:ubiquitin modifier activating enzyme 1 [Hymenolepis microstoma]